MRTNTYAPGSLIRLSAAFANISGTATDPTAVTFSYKDPLTGTVTSFVFGTSAMVKDSTGNYHFDLAVTDPGDYWYRWVGTGTVQAAFESSFKVNTTRVV